MTQVTPEMIEAAQAEVPGANDAGICAVYMVMKALDPEFEKLRQQRLMILAAVYPEAPKFVATICDTRLDPSGALLGEVRALSRAALSQEHSK